MSHGFHNYVEQRVNYRVIYYPLWIIPATWRAWSTLNTHIRGLQGGWQHHGGQQQPGDRWSCYGALGQVARWGQFLVGKSPHVFGGKIGNFAGPLVCHAQKAGEYRVPFSGCHVSEKEIDPRQALAGVRWPRSWVCPSWRVSVASPVSLGAGTLREIWRWEDV